MIGLILIYFVGKAYYDLAGQYAKSQWGYAILGVGSYYGGQFLAGILAGIIIELWWPGELDSMSDITLGLMALPFGVLCCWGLYKYFQKSWANAVVINSDDQLLDSDMFKKHD
jgi:hypothetical protein